MINEHFEKIRLFKKIEEGKERQMKE